MRQVSEQGRTGEGGSFLLFRECDSLAASFPVVETIMEFFFFLLVKFLRAPCFCRHVSRLTGTVGSGRTMRNGKRFQARARLG